MKLVDLLTQDKDEELKERLPRIVNHVARSLSSAWDSAEDQITKLEARISDLYKAAAYSQRVDVNEVVRLRQEIASLEDAQDIIAAEWKDMLGTEFKPTILEVTLEE